MPVGTENDKALGLGSFLTEGEEVAGAPVGAGELGLGERILGGFGVGISELPGARFTFPLLGQAAELLPGIGPLARTGAIGQAARAVGVPTSFEEAGQLREEIEFERSTVADVSRLAGRFIPELSVGAGAFNLGRFAATRALQAAAPKLAARFGGRASEQLTRVAARAVDVAGARAPQIAKPFLERTAEAFGSALGLGSLSGAETLVETGDVTEATKAAAIAAVLTLGFEGAVGAVGRVISPRARGGFRDPSPAIERFRETVGEAAGARVFQMQERLTALRSRLDRVMSVEAQEVSLLRQTSEALVERAGVLEQAGKQAGTVRTLRMRAAVLRARAAARPVPRRAVALQRGIQRRQARVQALERFADVTEVIPATIVRGGPVNPSGYRREAEKFLTQFLQSPTASADKVGVSGVRFIQMVEDAEILIQRASTATDKSILNLTKALGAATGRRVPKRPKNLEAMDALFADVFDAFEKGGSDAVRQRFGAQAASVMDGLSRQLDDLYRPVERLGGRPRLSPADLQRNGLQAYLPQVIGDVDEKVIRARLLTYLRGEGLSEVQAIDRVNRILTQRNRAGLQRFGSVDHQRLLPGSLKDKRAAGLPFVGPISGVRRYMNELARRNEYGKQFGFNGELRDTIVSLAEAEGADVPLVATIVDHFLARDYPTFALRRAMQSITSFQSGMKLAFSVIPNLTQQGNNAVFGGFQAAGRGMVKALSRARSKDAGKAVGITETEFDAINRVSSGVEGANLFDRFARAIMGGTGFTRAEQWNRLGGANTTIYTIEDTMAKAFAGRLRGNTLDVARRRMADFRINLDRVVRDGRQTIVEGGTIEDAIRVVHGDGAFDIAVFLGARLGQFIPITTRIPLAWQHPVGRVFFQFKTFMLNQGIFFRDQVLGEAALGNMGPLARMLAIYPIAGELVQETLGSVAGRKRQFPDGVARFVEDISMVGAGGIIQSMIVAAQFGRLTDTMLGPTVSDMSAMGEAALRLDLDAAIRQVRRQPTVRLLEHLLEGNVGGLELIMNYADADAEEVSDQPVTLDELLQESRP